MPRFQIRAYGEHGHHQVFDFQENKFLPGVGYPSAERDAAEAACSEWNDSAGGDVWLDLERRHIVTRCMKCGEEVRFSVGGEWPSIDALKAALRSYVEGAIGAACPPRPVGEIAPAAHFELGYWGIWQIERVLGLIDLLYADNILPFAMVVDHRLEVPL